MIYAIASFLLFLLCEVIASSAAADGALLAGSAGVERELGGMSRERAHRSLATARALALFGAGCITAFLLRAAFSDGSPIALLLLAVVGFGVVLGDASARATGDALHDTNFERYGKRIRRVARVLHPIVELSARADALLLRIFPPPPDEEERDLTQEQFREVVAAEAEITKEEAGMLAGVFELGDTEVRELMVPRVDIVGIERDTPWSEVVDRVRSSEHARFPVYDGTLDEIVGVLYAKDLLPAVIADEEPHDDWMLLVRPAVYIPGTKTADAQLRDFKASRNHIAIVVDEYGGTAGLITIENVLEEIVGEIRDEHDDEERSVEQEAGRRYWVSGRVSLDELSELLEQEFEHEEVTTVGGLVYERLGRVPRPGEQFTLGDYRVVVERVRRRRVERVFFERAESLAAREAQ